jgi:hypothetical protein
LYLTYMSWQKFIYTSKNNPWTWRNFTSYHLLMETDLSQCHAATTPCTETADQDSHKHFSRWWMGTEVLKVWPPWSLNLTLLDFYLWIAYENWCEVWIYVCLKWRVRDDGELVNPYALMPVWQEHVQSNTSSKTAVTTANILKFLFHSALHSWIQYYCQKATKLQNSN